MLRSRVMARFAYFEYLFRTVRSETSGATLYLAVSSALQNTSCKSDKRAAKLHIAVQQQPLLIRWARPLILELFLATIMVDHFPFFVQCKFNELYYIYISRFYSRNKIGLYIATYMHRVLVSYYQPFSLSGGGRETSGYSEHTLLSIRNAIVLLTTCQLYADNNPQFIAH